MGLDKTGDVWNIKREIKEIKEDNELGLVN